MAGPTPEPAQTVVASLVLSFIAYYVTAALVPLLGPELVAKGLGGVDMLKRGFVRAPTAVQQSGDGSGDGEDVSEAPVQRGVVLYVPISLPDGRTFVARADRFAGPRRRA